MIDQINDNKEILDQEALSQWWMQINEWREQYGIYTQPRHKKSDKVIKPQSVIETLYEITKGDAYVTSDVGQHQMWAAQYYKFDKPNRWINSGGPWNYGFRFACSHGCPASLSFFSMLCYWRS